ncbi:protein kinase, partial [bacterium]|nr:protein kinase [bacterium]
MITFACPQCASLIDLSEKQAGTRGPCPYCRTVIQAPVEAGTLETRVSPDEPAEPRARAAPSRLERARGADLAAEVASARSDPRRAFGNLLLLGEIGRGGMGVVYRAWNDGLRRVVAVKTILAEVATEDAIKRFHREVEAVARLRHPNIVAVHDAGTLAGTHYLVMDFIDGSTLDRRVGSKDSSESESQPRSRLPRKKAVEILRDVARSVHYAHEQGVIHRDLKPQNVILDRNDCPYVLDFGL